MATHSAIPPFPRTTKYLNPSTTPFEIRSPVFVPLTSDPFPSETPLHPTSVYSHLPQHHVVTIALDIHSHREILHLLLLRLLHLSRANRVSYCYIRAPHTSITVTRHGTITVRPGHVSRPIRLHQTVVLLVTRAHTARFPHVPVQPNLNP